MARWGRCNYAPLKAFSDKLEKLTDSEMTAFCISCSKELAGRLLSLVIPATPVGKYPKSSGKKGGTLRRGWGAATGNAGKEYAQSLTVVKSGATYAVEIVNPVEYASYVEFGHRTVNGGWVEGRYMLTISEEKLKKIAPSVLEKLILQKLKEVFNGGN